MSNHAAKVIIRGYVFEWDDKAPFVPSGVSVYGAIEWDEAQDKIRCHECGEWYKDLASHVNQGHTLDTREYRERHGLRLSTPLWAFSLRRNTQERFKTKTGMGFKPGNRHGQFGGRSRGNRSGAETANMNGRCCAQELFKIQTLAAQLGRTPTVKELEENKLCAKRLRVKFNASMADILRMAGLTPNPPGPSVSKLDNERMPWPADYFEIQPFLTRRI
jgi:hypothetical protein